MKTRPLTVLVHFTTALFLLVATGIAPVAAAPAAPAAAPAAALLAPSCPAEGCAVTIDARDYGSSDSLANFNFIINVDNTKLPDDPFPSNTESNSPVVKVGDQDNATVNLPDGRYLISVRSLGHKMWGKHITLPQDAGNVRIDLTQTDEDHPLPLGKIRVFVFEDTSWTNGAPDTEETGLGGFQIGLEEQTHSAVTVDYNNDPLCGGICLTDPDGFATLDNLGPATYFIDVHAPDENCNPDIEGSRWQQTTTIDGGLLLQAGVEEGSDGTGVPGEQLWEPADTRTSYWFGFVCAPQDFATPGTGEIVGTARNWQGWPPFDVLTMGEPVQDPFVALSDSTTDQTVFIGRGDGAGNFDIQNVPDGSYNLAIWDEQLTYIIRFKPVDVAGGAFVDVNDLPDVNGEVGIGVSRWFGWLDGYVFKDTNGNQIMDPGEAPIANTDMDQRWRDGSIKEATFTGPDGYYDYPTAEGGALGKWIINEQGFGRFGVSGASMHDEHTGAVTAVPTDLGGALLNNQLISEGHRATVDWGKTDYAPGEPGQIVGVTYWATTRNEFNAALQAHEDYEPGIPDVTVYLEGLGTDGDPNTADDVILNAYVTDHWVQPGYEDAPLTQDCSPIRDFQGAPVLGLNPNIAPNCLEVPINGEQTKDGAFDGGYAFADYCPESTGGYNESTGLCADNSDLVPLVPGDYIVHVIMPKDPADTRPCNPATLVDQNISDAHGNIPGGGTGCLYRVVREEDVNVDLGNQFTPAIPPPPCVGDEHTLDQASLVTRSPYFGDPSAQAPLCDKHLVVLLPGQNANADFNMMTNFRTDPNGDDPGDTRTGDVQEPGRIIGLISNDIYFETDPQSIWYGEPRPIGGIPVGIYARVDTAGANPNANPPFDANNWRLFTTVWSSPEGTYEALLPSTETFNCPIPQGPCPGMYLFKINDPGTEAPGNAGYNPDLRTETVTFDVWPGLTDQLDTPLVPTSGSACQDPAGGVAPENGDIPFSAARPEILQVSTPVVSGTGSNAARQITIKADFIGPTGTATGATGVRATLTDLRTGTLTTLTRSNSGIQSWVPQVPGGSVADTIVIRVPAINTSTFRPGQYQLTITRANASGGVSSHNGVTIHVLGSNGSGGSAVAYTPPVVNVAPPPPAGSGSIQAAIDAATPGSLIVLSAGTYNENVLMWKPVKLQGLGAGGIIGAHELAARDPDDPRFGVPGSIIDGRFFDATAFGNVVTAHSPYAVDPTLPDILTGADVTAVAKSGSAYDLAPLNLNGSNTNAGIFSAARIDGLGLMTGRGQGAGGVQLQANINNMQLTNNELENNNGNVAGGIGLGQPFAHASNNHNVRMAFNRVLGNGGLTQAGGIGIFYDSNNYDVTRNLICANYSVNYGAGFSHIGLSPGGSIHDNQIIYNEAVDAGGGLAIESEVPAGGGLGDGTGAVNVDRNLIQSNFSGDDGGGIYLLNALTEPINIRNNMVVDNGAATLGGAMTMLNSSNVRIINNTVANNANTASSESTATAGLPHSAGLASEANTQAFQDMLPGGSPLFSNPVALFNNIFWNNQAYTLSSTGPGATLVPQGFIDFEVYGAGLPASSTFTPRYSDLTNGQILGPDGALHNLPANQGNLIGTDPLFVAPFILELTVSGSRLDPQVAAVTITTAGDPPIGLTGDYHIQPLSAMINRGAGFSNLPFPAPGTIQTPTASSILAPCSGTSAQGYPADFDREWRPRGGNGITTPWDLGADEVQAGTQIVIPKTNGVDLNWNGAGQLQCSGSTVP